MKNELFFEENLDFEKNDENFYHFVKNFEFQILAGTINYEDNFRFKRLIFRMTKGNCLIIIEEINDNLRANGNEFWDIKKVIFFLKSY